MAWKTKHSISAKQLFKWLMLFSVLCLFLPRSLTDRLDQAVSSVVGPLSGGARQFSLTVTDKLPQPGPSTVPAEQYQHLKAKHEQAAIKITNLQEELQQQRELNLELSGISQEFGLARARLIIANVTGSDSSDWPQTLQLDQGNEQHLRNQQLALSLAKPTEAGPDNLLESNDIYQMSVVGRISNTGRSTSTLQLITDSEFSYPVSVVPRWDRQEDWRADGHLYGKGMGKMTVRFISNKYPVKPGDTVLACSNPKYLPVEMLIGWVQNCRLNNQNPVVWEITVVPVSRLHNLRRVVIIDTANQTGD
jgi:cell shape-determining protein MreC